MGDFGHDFNKFLEIVTEIYNKYGSLDDYARGEGVWRFRVFGMYTVTARAIMEYNGMDQYDTSLFGAQKLLDDIVGTTDWAQLSDSHLCHRQDQAHGCFVHHLTGTMYSIVLDVRALGED